jgi:GntR family transcriptional regulator
MSRRTSAETQMSVFPAESPTPLYHQVHLVLRERIEQGYYGLNDVLPSEMVIAREFHVSRITVARAINDLAQIGLVERRRGSGTRIVMRDVTPPVAANIDGLLESLTEMGSRTQAKVLEFGFVLPTAEVQRELQVGVEELVQRAVRVRSYNGEPFSYLTSFVPGYIGQHVNEDDMNAVSLLSILEKNNVKIGSARQSFSATLADPRTGGALAITVGSPLLSITRTVLDLKKRPVEFVRILYRIDRYQYRMTLEREKEGNNRFWSTKGRSSERSKR